MKIFDSVKKLSFGKKIQMGFVLLGFVCTVIVAFGLSQILKMAQAKELIF